MDWDKVNAKTTTPPFVPKIKHPGDTSNFKGRYKETEELFHSKFMKDGQEAKNLNLKEEDLHFDDFTYNQDSSVA